MKKVQLTGKDVSILKGCSMSSVQKERTTDDLVSLRDALRKIGTSQAPPSIDSADDQVRDFDLETAEHSALLKLWTEGHGNIRCEEGLLDATINCKKHLDVAKDAKPEK